MTTNQESIPSGYESSDPQPTVPASILARLHPLPTIARRAALPQVPRSTAEFDEGRRVEGVVTVLSRQGHHSSAPTGIISFALILWAFA
jgi:hypothetical protein